MNSYEFQDDESEITLICASCAKPSDKLYPINKYSKASSSLYCKLCKTTVINQCLGVTKNRRRCLIYTTRQACRFHEHINQMPYNKAVEQYLKEFPAQRFRFNSKCRTCDTKFIGEDQLYCDPCSTTA